MEIRSVENEVKNEYPKLKQVSKKHLLNIIPNKWMKVGISFLGITMIMKRNVFAYGKLKLGRFEITEIELTTAGFVANSIPRPIKICYDACNDVQLVSAVVFIITGLSIFITKIKSKKQSEPIKVRKWVKVIFILSTIVFILSILTQFIINNIYY